MREPELFDRFEKSSSAAAKWLRQQENRRRIRQDSDLKFVDQLLDIEEETALLKELKDIRDELNIISMILKHQVSVLNDLEAAIAGEHEDLLEVTKRFREQKKMIDVHIKDVDRMDKQADAIFKSVRSPGANVHSE
jgi:hypothetical protein